MAKYPNLSRLAGLLAPGTLPEKPADRQRMVADLIFVIAVAMALFHMWTAGIRPMPGVQQRSIHLAFALALIFLMFPFKPREDDL